MIRTALAISLIVLGVAPAAAQSGPTRLKSAVTVAGDIVRIGDLIENAGLAANTAIFRSPDIGQTGAVPVRTVLDAVRPYGLIGVDVRGVSEVSVTRASRTIATEEIEALIVRALLARYNLGKAENLKVMFERDVRPINLDASVTADLSLVRMSYEPGTRRFDVTFELASGGRAQWRYTGSAVETIEVAVMQRALAKGDIVRPADIALERRPKNEFSGEPAANPAEAAGMAARRTVRAGAPLRAADLARPELIQKNDTVMLHYQVPGIVITMRGKALDSGAEGDVVGVLNVSSKRTIQGIVTGPGRVSVQAPNTSLQAPSTAALAPSTAALAPSTALSTPNTARLAAAPQSE
jgi:flagellar basal body P-ring formation protein FlgA